MRMEQGARQANSQAQRLSAGQKRILGREGGCTWDALVKTGKRMPPIKRQALVRASTRQQVLVLGWSPEYLRWAVFCLCSAAASSQLFLHSFQCHVHC